MAIKGPAGGGLSNALCEQASWGCAACQLRGAHVGVDVDVLSARRRLEP